MSKTATWSFHSLIFIIEYRLRRPLNGSVEHIFVLRTYPIVYFQFIFIFLLYLNIELKCPLSVILILRSGNVIASDTFAWSFSFFFSFFIWICFGWMLTQYGWKNDNIFKVPWTAIANTKQIWNLKLKINESQSNDHIDFASIPPVEFQTICRCLFIFGKIFRDEKTTIDCVTWMISINQMIKAHSFWPLIKEMMRRRIGIGCNIDYIKEMRGGLKCDHANKKFFKRISIKTFITHLMY